MTCGKRINFKLASIPLSLALVLGCGMTTVSAQEVLGDASLEDLLKTDVVSVSRKSQSLTDVPAAAFVISADDIRRSGALALPDVLRMVPGIEVAQIDSGRFAVSARGFNARFANKLQVMIDGRSIYSRVFSGVLWENDLIPLEDIERIEIIRGPGAAMWGFNTVNGVINIISRHSRDQQGSAATLTIGSTGEANIYARHASAIDEKTTWKLSFQGRHAEPSKRLDNNAQSEDRLNNGVIDFRFDKDLDAGRDLSLWGYLSHSSMADNWRSNPLLSPYYQGVGLRTTTQTYETQSLMGRYRWLSDKGIENMVQGGIANAVIDIPGFYREQWKTYDIEYQGRYSVGGHDLLWGLSHRSSPDRIRTEESQISMAHPKYTMRTSGIFLHDDWTIIPEWLTLGAGARWDHTDRGDSTFSPRVTLMLTPTRLDTLWVKYAQAPRVPTRAEHDVTTFSSLVPPSASLPLPTLIRVRPSAEMLRAEKMEGVELGYRKQFTNNFNLDLTTYRYRYTGLRSGLPAGAPDMSLFPSALIQDFESCNCLAGWSSGVELSADWMVYSNWRLQLSYSVARLDMDSSANTLLNQAAVREELAGPRHYGSLRSQWNLSPHQQFDAWVRGSAGYERANAPFPDQVRVPGYVTLDLRYAHRINKQLEVALTGRNLIGQKRTEFVADYLPSVPVVIAPSVLLTTRFNF